MATIKENIAARFPQATFEDADVLQINIPDAQLHDLAAALRDDYGYDYLITIAGVDRAGSLGGYHCRVHRDDSSRGALYVVGDTLYLVSHRSRVDRTWDSG